MATFISDRADGFEVEDGGARVEVEADRVVCGVVGVELQEKALVGLEFVFR